MNYDYLKLIKILKEERTKKNLSQRQLAKKIGVSNGEISKIENGLKSNFSFIILAKICEELDIDVEQLLIEIGLKNIKNREEKEYYVLFKNVDEDIVVVHSNSNINAVLKAYDVVESNNLIKYDKEKMKSFEVYCTDNIEDFMEDYPEAVNKLADRLEIELDEEDDEIEEDFISENEENDIERCNSCEFYCPTCGKCTYGD